MNHSPVNVIAWGLAVAGIVAFVSAAIGVVYFLSKPGQISPEMTSTYLHDTYYVIRYSRQHAWPMLLCMTLAAAIAIIGYLHTDYHFRRVIRTHVNTSAKS